MSDTETLSVYAKGAKDYARRFNRDGQIDPSLADFMAELPHGGTVLDLGCGPGAASGVMADAGFKVTATDAVPEMVELAGQHPGVTAFVARFDEIAGEDLYDGVWANFSLLHADRADMPAHLDAIVRALRPDGCLHIGLKLGEGAARDGIGRLYTYYSEDELEGLLSERGLKIVARRLGETKGFDGTMAPWITVRARA